MPAFAAELAQTLSVGFIQRPPVPEAPDHSFLDLGRDILCGGPTVTRALDLKMIVTRKGLWGPR